MSEDARNTVGDVLKWPFLLINLDAIAAIDRVPIFVALSKSQINKHPYKCRRINPSREPFDAKARCQKKYRSTTGVHVQEIPQYTVVLYD
jgi:hypothetical protein